MKIHIRPHPRSEGWEVDIDLRASGGPRVRRKSPFPGKRDSERWARKLLHELTLGRDGTDISLPTGDAVPHTLAEALERWLSIGSTVGFRGKPWSQSYVRERRRLVTRICGYQPPEVGSIALGDLEIEELPAVVDDVLLWLHNEKGLAPKTINHHIEAFQGAALAARRAGWELPELSVRLLSTEPRDLWLREEDLAACVDECRNGSQPERLKALWLLGARAGLRAGELRALRWNDLVGVKTPTGEVVSCVLVRHNLPSKITDQTLTKLPKNNRARLIPLHPDLARALGEFGAVVGAHSGALVFAQESDPNKSLGSSSLHRAIAGVAQRAGVAPVQTDPSTGRVGSAPADEAQVSAHVLRHTFATHLENRGVARYLVSKLLGHIDHSPRVTAHYAHSDLTAGLPELARAISAIPSLAEVKVSRIEDAHDVLSVGDLLGLNREKFGVQLESQTAQTKKPAGTSSGGLLVVAGTGFEPAASGL